MGIPVSREGEGKEERERREGGRERERETLTMDSLRSRTHSIRKEVENSLY